MEQIRKFECEECEEILFSHSRFIQHSLSHIGVTVLCCEICEKLFHHDNELKQHACLYTNHDNHKDSECITSCAIESDLTEHVNISNTESFKCDECGKIFNDKSHFVQHKNTHSVRRVRKDMNPPNLSNKAGKHICCECNKTFASKSTLIVHMSIHTETDQDECNEFKVSSSINNFARPLSLKKLYKCHRCNEFFTQKRFLDEHVKLHTGGSKCVCDVCGRRFNEKISLMHHIRTHMGRRKNGGTQYKCDECGKICRRESSLKQHKYVHMEVKKYICDKCGRKLSSKKNLLTHVRNIHNVGKNHWQERIIKQVRMKKKTHGQEYISHTKKKIPRRAGCVKKVGKDNISTIIYLP